MGGVALSLVPLKYTSGIMASEDLQQRYPKGTGQRLGNLELFESQITTLNQFAEAGILPDRDYGQYKAQKCDALVIRRQPSLTTEVIGEHKSPGSLNEANWLALAKDLLVTKCHPTGAALGYLSDGVVTHWINGRADEVTTVAREDGRPMPRVINYKDRSFIAEFCQIVDLFDPIHSLVRTRRRSNPDLLAREVWQTIWRLKADSPEDCLATFVEIFLFKFLNDLGLLRRDSAGADVSLDYVMTRDRDKCYAYYESVIRPHVKTLFPLGPDGYSIINGIVLQSGNRDHNLIFHEILKKFIRFGSLANTEPEFKTRLYESFLRESKTTSTFGQFFTPRKIVSAIHDMAQVGRLPAGKSICDPAAGVGGFVLEQMARDLATQWTLKGNRMVPTHDWLAYEVVPKTAILAKANALVHCGDLLADQPERIKSFAKWLNEVFVCKDKTSLGSLEEMFDQKFDLIITNPPFVVSGSRDVSKLIKSNNRRRTYYGRKYSGVEGLFIQFIAQSLKRNGDAWVLLPETFFLRTTDQTLRSWLLGRCQMDLMAILPERTFFNTPKRVVVTHLKRRPADLSEANLQAALRRERVLLFAVSEIGETRDAKRLPCETNLPELVEAYARHAAGQNPPPDQKRAAVITADHLFNKASVNLRHHWDKAVAEELGLLDVEADPITARVALGAKMDTLKAILADWTANVAVMPAPRSPAGWKTVKLGDRSLFALSIGRRVLKKQIYQNRTGTPLFSANIRKPFGYVHAPNAGNLPHGGALWSIDSDFDCRGVSAGEPYSITDHCGQIALQTDQIDPSYLSRQVRNAGLNQGFNRDYRPSLGLIRELEVDLPIAVTGDFDLELMKEWTDFQDHLDRKSEEITRLLA